MGTPFEVQCSKCSEKFESIPGKLNSTCYLGEVSQRYGVGGFLPKCPNCGNWRDNHLVTPITGELVGPLRY